MEVTFQKIVLTIAIVLLIGFLIVINMSLTNESASKLWPPVKTDCPDYWEDLSGNGSQCFNFQDIGKCTDYEPKFGADEKPLVTSTMNFSGATYTGPNGLCEKQKWAKACEVQWDGITYGYGSNNPCDTKLKLR
jgi:hypothetical protein